MSKLSDWHMFEKDVACHIEETQFGHYTLGKTDVIDFMESYFGLNAATAWTHDIIKYIIRAPIDNQPKDLLKAAHYLCRMYMLMTKGNVNEEMDCSLGHAKQVGPISTKDSKPHR